MPGSYRDPDLAAVRAVADRILDEVADRLRKQLAVAEQRYRRAGGSCRIQRGAALLGQRLVHFGELGGELADVEPGELVAAGQRFGAADLQHRRQDPHQRIGLADDAAEQFFLLRRVAGFRRRMRRRAQAG